MTKINVGNDLYYMISNYLSIYHYISLLFIGIIISNTIIIIIIIIIYCYYYLFLLIIIILYIISSIIKLINV